MSAGTWFCQKTPRRGQVSVARSEPEPGLTGNTLAWPEVSLTWLNHHVWLKKKNQPVCTFKTTVLCCYKWTPEQNLWRSSGAEPPGSCQSSLLPSASSPPHAGFDLRLWNGGCKVPADLSPGTAVHVGLMHYSDIPAPIQLMHRNHLRLTLWSSTSFTDSIAW